MLGRAVFVCREHVSMCGYVDACVRVRACVFSKEASYVVCTHAVMSYSAAKRTINVASTYEKI